MMMMIIIVIAVLMNYLLGAMIAEIVASEKSYSRLMIAGYALHVLTPINTAKSAKIFISRKI
jgi:hypothetical protein